MIFCSKCGNSMNEGDVFCTKCGATQSQQGAAPAQPAQGYGPPPQGYGPPPQGYGPYGPPPYGPYGPQYAPRKGSNLWQRIRQMEGENLVKTFVCSRLKSLLLWNFEADGFLSVTNKRLIYWSEDSKPGERTVLQQEMKLSDASGVSLHKGRIFSWLHLAWMYLFNSLAVALLMTLLALIGSASLVAMKVVALVIGFGSLGGAIYYYVTDKRFTNLAIPVLLNLSWLGFFIAVGAAALSSVSTLMYSAVNVFGGLRGASGDGIAWAIFAALAGLAYLVSLVLYAVRPSFSLTVFSRAGGKAVHLAGLRIIGRGALSSKAMSAEPAEDSELLANQLGAMIAELQEKGDAAVEKWSK
jgi:hypothetical protein